MAGGRSVTIYGTVMGTRREGSDTVHRIEATDPGGERIALKVVARRRHRGAVKVALDSDGHVEPRFCFEMPCAMVGVAVGIIAVVVLGSWLILG